MTEPSPDISIKRAYEPPARGDGVRVLVDRLWPRGLRKDSAHFDQWRKDLSPSTELRQFYAHRPERFVEFTKRYRTELRRKEAVAAISELIDLTRRRPVTLLTASRDLDHSEAAVLARHLRTIIKRRARRPAHPNRSRVGRSVAEARVVVELDDVCRVPRAPGRRSLSRPSASEMLAPTLVRPEPGAGKARHLRNNRFIYER